jgi:hypothetical protein
MKCLFGSASRRPGISKERIGAALPRVRYLLFVMGRVWEVTRDSAIAGASVLRGSFQKFGESLFRWNNMSDRHVLQPTPCVQEVSALPP